MTFGPPDEIERTIDEVLASVVAGEPRRVNATSVRQALNAGAASRIPFWLAAAAVLLVGFVVALKNRPPIEKAPDLVARSTETAGPSEARPAHFPEPIQVKNLVAGVPARPRRAGTTAPYEGLPRLAFASIELPMPLSTGRLEADAIQIPRIEIAPLFVSSLSIEQEHNQ